MMSDVFQETLEADEPERGPFRTGEPTHDKRLQKARDASLDRVALLTSEMMDAERGRDRRWDATYMSLLALSALGLVAVIALAWFTEGHWLPWLCPACAGVVSFGIIVWKRWALRQPRDDG